MLNNCYETPRLRLLLSREKYAAWVLAYYLRNKAFLKPYESARPEALYTLPHQRRFLALEAKRAKQGSAARFFLSPKNPPPGQEVIGLVALCNIQMGAFCSAVLAYNLDEAWGRQDLMHEALQKVVELAFGELGLHRLEANIMPHNTRSLNAVKRLGFTEEGLSKDYFEIDGRWEDHLHMVLLNHAMPPPGGF